MSSNSVPRYCPERALPPYSYVPGLAPHPTSDPRGHSYDVHERKPAPLTPSSYGDNVVYLYAIDLFNHGFYWEAHEAWEALWHVAGRSGPEADFLKGLIKLAAAGVKLREGRAAGVRQHADRAAELFRGVAESEVNRGGLVFGLRLEDMRAAAAHIAERAPELTVESNADAKRKLPLELPLVDR
jgi:hypothetical protein